VEHYEQLRARALANQADGFRLGLAVLVDKGMAAWIKVAGACPTPAPRHPAGIAPQSTARHPNWCVCWRPWRLAPGQGAS
jgi:hypothetical protein